VPNWSEFGQELVNKRSRSAKVFPGEKPGEYRAIVAGKSYHYEPDGPGSGDWQDIDTSLAESTNAYTNTANRWHFALFKDYGREWPIVIKRKNAQGTYGFTLKYKPFAVGHVARDRTPTLLQTAQDSTAVVEPLVSDVGHEVTDHSVVTYPNIFSGVDLRLLNDNDYLRKEIVISESAKGNLRQAIVNQNLDPQGWFAIAVKLDLSGMGAWNFDLGTGQEKTGNIRILSPADWPERAEDAVDRFARISVRDESEETADTETRYRLINHPTHGLVLLLLVPLQWLKDSVGAVTIDPTYYSSTSDGYVDSGTQSGFNAAHGADPGDTASDNDSSLSDAMTVSKSLSQYRIYRSFFYFDTSGIDDGATINSTDLKIYGYSNADSTVHAQKGTQGASLDTDDFQAFSGSSYGSTSWATGSYNTITFNATGEGDIDKTGTTKVCCREASDYNDSDPGASKSNGCYYADDSGSNADNRDPYLDITYSTNSAPSAPTSLECEGQTNPTDVTDTTPEFSAIYQDPDTGDTATHMEIEVGTSQDGSDMWDSGWIDITNVTEGNRSQTVSYSGSSLSLGQKYYYRIRFKDDDAAEGAWSDGTDYFKLETSYTYSTKIPAQASAVGDDETSFPAALVVTDSRFATTANGGHVENTDASGGVSGSLTVPADFEVRTDPDDAATLLDFEFVDYTASSGYMELWIEIDSLSKDNDTDVYFCYGNSDVTTSQENVSGTWGNSYDGVWHVGDDFVDSVGNQDATNSGTDDVSGKIGDGQDIVSSNSDYIDLNAEGQIGSSGSFSFWFKPDWSSNDSATHALFGAATDGSNFFRGEHYNDNTWYIGFYVSSTDYRVIIDATDMPVSSGTWYLLTVTWDDTANNTYVYLDDTSEGSKTDALSTVTPSGSFYVGRYSSTYGDFVVDEIILSSVVRDANWVATSYNNQSDPTPSSTFWSALGSEQGAAVELAATAAGDAICDVTLVKVIYLDATSIGDATVTAHLTATYNLFATAVGDSTVTADADVTWRLDAEAIGDAIGTANILITRMLAGTASGEADYRAPPQVTRNLKTTAVGGSSASADADVTWRLDATAVGEADASANLYVGTVLNATCVGGSEASADIGVTFRLDATAVGDAEVSAPLQATYNLAATAVGDSEATASETVTRTVDATGVGESSASATLEVSRNLDATTVGGSVASAHLQTTYLTSATGVGDSEASADLDVTYRLDATSVGDSEASANLTVTWRLAATAVGDSVGVAALQKQKDLAATCVGDSSVSARIRIAPEVSVKTYAGHDVILYDASNVQSSRLRKWQKLNYTVRLNAPGDCEIAAHKDVTGSSDLVSDNKVEIQRRGQSVFEGKFDWENPSYGSDGVAYRTTRGANFDRLPPRNVLRNAGTAATGNPDDVMKHFARYCWGGSAAASRQLSGFSVEANSSQCPGTYHISAGPKDSAMDVISRIGKACGVDWWVDSDVSADTYTFKTGYPRRGTDKSSSIVFTVNRGNVVDYSYELDTVNKVNLVYVGGPGEAAEQTIGTYHGGAEPTGWDRREAFVRATDAELSDELAIYGSAYLDSFGSGVENVKFGVFERDGYEWPTDYDLGDLVTVYDPKFGNTVTAKIEEVSVSVDAKGIEELSLTVGKPRPSEWEKLQAGIGPYSRFNDNQAPSTPTWTGGGSAWSTTTVEDSQGNQSARLTLDWDDNTELDLGNYQVEMRQVGAGTVWETQQVSESQAVFNKLDLGGTYYVRVKAVDTAGNESGYLWFNDS